MGEHEIKQVIRDLEDRGVSLAAIGRELGVTRQSVSRTLRRPAESARIREAIAAKLGRDPWARQHSAA
jgi:lambda repressor-like predicted transcriptional regulator